MARVKTRLEKATGLVFGTYLWCSDDPPPRFAVILRSAEEQDMVRAEVIIGRRALYATPRSG